jgi:nicotinamide mononucleotide transporter
MFYLEWFAALTCLLAVVLTAWRKIACWPVGLVGVAAYTVFFWQLKLYADAGLQVFFFATGLFGWWHWARGGPGHDKAPIRVLTGRQRLLWAAAWLLCILVVGEPLARHTDASAPHWDAFCAGGSVVGQLLTMRKVLDNWYVWIIVDVVYIGLYVYKGAWVTTGLFAIFVALAVAGAVAWRRALRTGIEA